MPNQKLLNLLPLWRLPNGKINAKDNELESFIDLCEKSEWVAGGIVGFGVLATVAIAVFHPSYDSPWERWGSACADSLVAIGIFVEIMFSQMAGLRQKELKRRSDERVAAAEERTRTAELALGNLQKRLEPRMLDMAAFLGVFANGADVNVEILYSRDGEDTFSLALQIAGALNIAGCRVKHPQPLTARVLPRASADVSAMLPLAMLWGGQPSGVSVVARSCPVFMRNNSEEPLSPCDVLATVLFRALGRLNGGTDETLSVNDMRIVVAPKQ